MKYKFCANLNSKIKKQFNIFSKVFDWEIWDLLVTWDSRTDMVVVDWKRITRKRWLIFSMEQVKTMGIVSVSLDSCIIWEKGCQWTF